MSQQPVQPQGSVPAAYERPAGLPYHLVLLGGLPGWWRYVVGVGVLAAGMILVAPLVLLMPFAIYFLAAGVSLTDAMTILFDLQHPTPSGLAYLNLSLASAIPLAWLVVRVVHGLRPGWLASVRPRLRWRYFLACLGVAVVALLATLVVSALLPSSASDGTELS